MRSPVNTANSHILKSETVNWLVNTATRSKFRKLKCLWPVNFKMRDYIGRQVTPPKLPYSGLRDSGEKSFSKKKCEERAGVGESLFSRRHRPFSPSRARLIFALLVLLTSPLYYLRAWYRLRLSGLPQLPEVSHLHVNRPLITYSTFKFLLVLLFNG